MKSVGLAVIMAQAGLYVPATRMDLRAYRHLFTRITKHDDIFNGLSSFQVEMLEIGNIVRRCTPDSLVIGDELCSGTETTSAVAIVGASVGEIVARKAHFLFATHLHELRHIPDIATNDSVRCVHMHVDVDSEGVMTYRRKLVAGSGPDTYGIEACAGFGLPRNFLRNARRYRHLLTPSGRSGASTLQQSSYNSTVICGRANRCSVPGCEDTADETHHLVHQTAADAATGAIGDGRNVHSRSNLMPLCRTHHALMHARDAPNVGAKWVQTSSGVRPQMCLPAAGRQIMLLQKI